MKLGVEYQQNNGFCLDTSTFSDDKYETQWEATVQLS